MGSTDAVTKWKIAMFNTLKADIETPPCPACGRPVDLRRT
jgi:hypothetical protein